MLINLRAGLKELKVDLVAPPSVVILHNLISLHSTVVIMLTSLSLLKTRFVVCAVLYILYTCIWYHQGNNRKTQMGLNNLAWTFLLLLVLFRKKVIPEELKYFLGGNLSNPIHDYWTLDPKMCVSLWDYNLDWYSYEWGVRKTTLT